VDSVVLVSVLHGPVHGDTDEVGDEAVHDEDVYTVQIWNLEAGGEDLKRRV